MLPSRPTLAINVAFLLEVKEDSSEIRMLIADARRALARRTMSRRRSPRRRGPSAPTTSLSIRRSLIWQNRPSDACTRGNADAMCRPIAASSMNSAINCIGTRRRNVV